MKVGILDFLQKAYSSLLILIADEITAREILKLKDELYQIIAKHSKQKIDKVNKDSDRDYWMKAEEAKSYGMVDEVLGLAK